MAERGEREAEKGAAGGPAAAQGRARPAAKADGGGDAAAGPEVGGREGPDPTRYGDWEKNGRCIDF